MNDMEQVRRQWAHKMISRCSPQSAPFWTDIAWVTGKPQLASNAHSFPMTARLITRKSFVIVLIDTPTHLATVYANTDWLRVVLCAFV